MDDLLANKSTFYHYSSNECMSNLQWDNMRLPQEWLARNRWKLPSVDEDVKKNLNHVVSGRILLTPNGVLKW